MATRTLTTAEINYARSIFGTTINYSQVRIVDSVPVAVQRLSGGVDAIVNPAFYTLPGRDYIYFDTSKYAADFSTAPESLKLLFVHEMMHVHQAQGTYGQLGLAAGVAEILRKYDNYNDAYPYVLSATTKWEDLNIEQQAEVVKDYAASVLRGEPDLRLADLIPFQVDITTPTSRPPNYCFLAGTPVSMWDGSKKFIEDIEIGDVVVSYDEDDNLQPGTVSDTLRNKKKHILDFHGLKVTPGHVVLCGDGRYSGFHVPIIEVLKTDGAMVQEDGTLIRAATEEVVGSRGDAFVQCLYAKTNKQLKKGVRYEGKMRVGTRLLRPDGSYVSVLECLQAEGLDFDEETGLVCKPGKTPHPLDYFGELPKPETYVLKRSKLTLEEIYSQGDWESVGAPSATSPTMQ